jgi:hypothetical protein
MAIEKVVNVKVVDNVEATTKNVANLKTQLRQAQNEVNELSAKFGATSKQAVEAAKRAADLKDAIGDAKALTDAFNPDAKFKALTSTLGGVAGGFAAVQGAVGLLGSESQSVEKALLKVQSAMAISQGVQAIGESVDSFKQLGAVIRSTTIFQKALSAATAIQTFVTNGATLAAKLLRGALISTGIGALVVGVGLLIANFDKVKKVVMTLIPGLSAVGDIVMGIVNTVTDFIGVTSEAGRSIDKMVSDSEKTLRKNQDFLDTQGDKYDDYTKRKIQANIDYAAKVKEVSEDETRTEDEKLKYLKDLRDKADREIEQADKDRQAEKDKKAKEAQDKLNEAEKTRLAKIKEANEAAQKIRDAAYEHEKLFVEQQLNDSKLSIDEKRNIVIVDMALSKKDREKFLYDLHLEEQKSEQEHAEKLKDINKRYDEEKENRLADTNVKKEELDYQRRKLEINSIAQTESEKLNLIAKLNEEHNAKMIDAKKEDAAKQKEIEKTLADAKFEIQMQGLDAIDGLIGLTKNLGEKSKGIQKAALIAESAVGIAKIIMNTNQANIQALANPANELSFGAYAAAKIPLNNITAGISIASTVAATAKGLAALGGGGSTGGGSMPSGGSMSTPPQFNIVGQSGTNQLAQTIAGQQNKPIEAFVVSSSVTTSQSLDRNRVKTATFGG